MIAAREGGNQHKITAACGWTIEGSHIAKTHGPYARVLMFAIISKVSWATSKETNSSRMAVRGELIRRPIRLMAALGCAW